MSGPVLRCGAFEFTGSCRKPADDEGDEDEAVAIGSSERSSKGKRGRGKKAKAEKEAVEEEEEEEEDEGPEEVTMASQRAVAEERKGREQEAAQRIEQMKQSKAEKEAAAQARREEQRAAKLRRQQAAEKEEEEVDEEAQGEQQSAPENQSQSSPDFLPDDLLQAIGQNVTSPRAPPHSAASERSLKKEAMERRLSKIWEETGIEVAVAKKPVEVKLPKAMVEFMSECKEKIARAPVAEKKKRQKRTPHKATTVM